MRFNRTTLAVLFMSAAVKIFAQDSDESFQLIKPVPVTPIEAVQETGGWTYIIEDVTFKTKGRTKPAALERNIPMLPKSHVFRNEAELKSYLENVNQQILNTRMFASSTYDFTSREENGVSYVKVTFYTKDSHNVLVLPKPSLDSNSGIELKFKLKDNNFLGLMNDLNIDFNGRLGNEDEPDNYSKVTIGINFSYDYPFELGVTKNEWSNSFSIDWEISESKPDVSFSTGLTVGIPVGEHELDVTFEQSVARNGDYVQYDDQIYFEEKAVVSMPFVIGYIGETTKVKYTPALSFKYTWDADGINEANEDLIKTPVVDLYQTFSFSRIDWDRENNFRNGYSFSTTQSFAFNFYDESLSSSFMPSLKGEAKYFLGFSWIGFEFDATFFTGMNTTTNVGSSIRGALDKQRFKDYDVDANNYALQTHSAITFSANMPVHIITTHWLDWSYAIFGAYDTKPKAIKILAALPRALFRYVDFEMQWSPFFDAALIENRGTGNIFFYKEGIYTCGLEVLVYPAKWKSFVVRGSIGIDVSKKILNGHKGFDSSWRKPAKAYEIYFGLGTHF